MSHRVSPEAREKMSKSHAGLSVSRETGRKISAANKGHIVTSETRAKLSKSHLGMKNSPEARTKMAMAKRGRRGVESNHWKGGVTPVNIAIRNSDEYTLWRTTVFIRDDYTCQKCRTKGIELEAHHMDCFADFPEKRLEVGNGITFCKECHYEFNHRYGVLHNRKWQTDEFLVE